MIEVFVRLRQWLQPREFRIADPGPEDDLVRLLSRIMGELEAREREPSAPAKSNDEQVLLRLANQVWDLDRKLRDPLTRRPRAGLEREARHAESMLSALAAAGIEVQDYTGKRFDDGLSLVVAQKVPIPDLTHPRIRETLRPSIYAHGRHVQQGSVIVEAPMPPSEDADRPRQNSQQDRLEPKERTSHEDEQHEPQDH